MRSCILFMFCFVWSVLCVAQNVAEMPSSPLNMSGYYDFKDAEQNETLELKNYEGRVPPRLSEYGYLHLMNGGYASNHNNAVVFPDTLSNEAEEEHFYFHLYITRGAKGAGFALVNTQHIAVMSSSPMIDDWTLPNLPHSFGVGINVYNPQTSHWFDEWGNYYGREEREISLHWDGLEIHRVLSPVEFRSDAEETRVHRWDVRIRYAVAGAYIGVEIDSTAIITEYFIPEMMQYEKQPVFGATTGELTCTVILDDFGFETTGEAPFFRRRISTLLLTDEVFHAERREHTGFITFPKATSRADRVILTLDLGGAVGGVSDWDVSGYIYLIDYEDDGDIEATVPPLIEGGNNRYELLRFITPYNRAYTWKVDVTDFLPLFCVNKGIYATVHTWEPVTENPEEQKGWKVSARLDFYEQTAEERTQRLIPYKIVNLWNGSFEYGDVRNPLILNTPETAIDIPTEANAAKLRIVVTGHGMHPNTDNAAEFRPADRTVIINGDEYQNLLWKTDNYLNPCRPQDGTWKFDRAGWAPGDIVRAWEIDLTKYIKDGKLTIAYIPDDYQNVNRGETWEPFHSFASQVIFYVNE